MNQKAAVTAEYDDTFKVPAVEYGESMEEQALRKEQDKTKIEMKNRQREKLQALQQEAELESKSLEQAARAQHEQNLEQAIREKKNKQATEIEARPDLTKQQMEAVSIFYFVVVCRSGEMFGRAESLSNGS